MLLLNAGSRVDINNYHGDSPISLARANNDDDITALIMRHWSVIE